MTTASLFTDPAKIKFECIHQPPEATDGDYYDFYLYETVLDRAVLTYDIKAGEWCAMVAETETDEDAFEDDDEATPAQLAAILSALPAVHRQAAENWQAA